jgi:hypothetical protein
MNRTHKDELAGGGGDLTYHAAPPELAHRFPGAKELSRQVDVDHCVPLLPRSPTMSECGSVQSAPV